uniref:RING-type E3 ubiquitin transferase n=1 Tax=Heliothis virescens TaxID=7102 RepID=A0A2A4JTE8_HELVI
MSSASNSPEQLSPSILVPESPEAAVFDVPEPAPNPEPVGEPLRHIVGSEQVYLELDYTLENIRQLTGHVGTRLHTFSSGDEEEEEEVSESDNVDSDANDQNVPNDPTVNNPGHNDPNGPVAPHPRVDALHSESTASTISEDSIPSLPDPNMRDSSNHEEAPPAKLRKVNSPPKKLDPDEETGETCPICLESWGNSGEHRLVALKCGHLFGSGCVERWLKAQLAKDRSCPTCKTKAAIKDIRFIYARKLIAVDTSQITNLQKRLENAQADNHRVEMELAKTKIAHRVTSAQLEELRKTVTLQTLNGQQSNLKWRFALEKNLEICKDGGCRVLTYNCRTYELYVSQKSTNTIFPGYGIRKVSCVDYKLGQFVHLHPKPIRDITYSQPRDLLLSVGLDSTARIVDRGIPSVTVQAGFPLWSCAWDSIRTNEFYVGGVGGTIHQYDFRNPSTCLQTLSGVGSSVDMSPVVSICSTQYGLMSCQLNSCWLWEAKNGKWEPRMLPVEGSFMSLNYDADSHRAVVAVRPSVNGTERSKLVCCKLTPSSEEMLIDVEDTFSSSATCSLMSRATFAKAPGASWVAAHSESDSTLYLHGLDGVRTMSLPAAEPAIDVASVQLNGNSLLAALSESRLRIYRAVPTT